MIQHIVCFKFKANTPPEAVEKHMSMFAAMKNSIPQITGYSGGRTFQGGGGDGEYDTVHLVTFEKKDDLDIYNHHEIHRAFIEANKAFWENVLVIDSEVGIL